MKQFINYGSINIDYVYRVNHFLAPGETQKVKALDQFVGGKGMNQSIALSHSQVPLVHLGKTHASDDWLIGELEKLSVDTSSLIHSDLPTGHAIIQVDESGENCILIYAGANADWTVSELEKHIDGANLGDWFLCQNETCHVLEALSYARSKGLTTCWNPAPAPDGFSCEHVVLVDYLLVNEVEAQVCFNSVVPADIQSTMAHVKADNKVDNKDWCVVLTLGGAGGSCILPDRIIDFAADSVEVVDTTASGDTFVGFFLASQFKGDDIETSIALAKKAAALCVTQMGAANSIPYLTDLI